MRLLEKMVTRYFFLLLVGTKVQKLNIETNTGTIGRQNVLQFQGLLEV